MDAAAQRKARLVCDVCGAEIEGEPAGKGLLIWWRGEERRTEEPALCKACAPAISAAGELLWSEQDED